MSFGGSRCGVRRRSRRWRQPRRRRGASTTRCARRCRGRSGRPAARAGTSARTGSRRSGPGRPAATAVLVLLGGLDQTIGWIGVGCLAIADAVAIPRIVGALRTAVALEEVTADLDPDKPASPYPRLQIALPFLASRRAGVDRRRGI